MAAGHLLADVEQQGVVAGSCNVDGSLVDIATAHLLAAALGGGDVDDLTGTLAFTPRQLDAAVAGVEVDKAIVVPQHAIALARQEHRQTDLGVDLRQAAAEAADIGIAILKLSETEEVFVLGRCKGQRRLTVFHLVARGGKDHPTLPVLYREQLALGIYINLDVVRRDLAVLHVNPVGQIILHLTLGILHPHGISCHGGHGLPSFSERHRPGRHTECRQQRHHYTQ